MLTRLAECIRLNKFNDFMALLSTPVGKKVKDDAFALTAVDMAQLQTLNNNAKDLKKLTQITDARLIFLTILYGRLDFFKVLLPYISNPSSLKMGGVDLTTFSLCQRHVLFFDALSDTSGFLADLGDTTTMWKQARGSSDLDKLQDAAEQGKLADVNEYIRRGVLKQDKDGQALFIALQHGHVECADALRTAFLSISGNKILPRHYYAAGMAENHRKMYYPLIVKPDQNATAAPNKTFPTPPTFIIEGDLEALQCNLSKDTDELASWLFHSIANNHSSCVNFLLKKGVEIKPKHYYAAGTTGHSNPFDAQYYFELLEGVEAGKIQRDQIKLAGNGAQPRNAGVNNKRQ